MKEIVVKSIHDAKNINSINERYILKVCETYIYIQDIMENKVLVEISLNTPMLYINRILDSFGFPKIIIDNKDFEKDQRIKQLENLISIKDKTISNQKSYIEELQSKMIIEKFVPKKRSVIEAYTALLGTK